MTERAIETKPPEQAPEGLQGWLVTLVLVAFVAVTVFCVLLVRLMLQGQRERVDDAVPVIDQPVIGRIEQRRIGISARGRDKAEAAERALSHYAIRDRDAGVASIPIERAFDWILEHPEVALPAGNDHNPGGTGPAPGGSR